MKIAIGIVLLYIIIVVLSASLMRFIWNSGFKGTEHEETWSKSLKSFALGYLVVGTFFAIIYLMQQFFFESA